MTRNSSSQGDVRMPNCAARHPKVAPACWKGRVCAIPAQLRIKGQTRTFRNYPIIHHLESPHQLNHTYGVTTILVSLPIPFDMPPRCPCIFDINYPICFCGSEPLFPNTEMTFPVNEFEFEVCVKIPIVTVSSQCVGFDLARNARRRIIVPPHKPGVVPGQL